VIGDERTLFPTTWPLDAAHPRRGRVRGAAHTSDDPVICRKLEEVSRRDAAGRPDWIRTRHSEPQQHRIIKEQARVPVIVDAV
jgi:thiazole synthase ThiGH ThiG subunit